MDITKQIKNELENSETHSEFMGLINKYFPKHLFKEEKPLNLKVGDIITRMTNNKRQFYSICVTPEDVPFVLNLQTNKAWRIKTNLRVNKFGAISKNMFKEMTGMKNLHVFEKVEGANLYQMLLQHTLYV